MTEDIDRSDELLDWYAEDTPDGAELLDDVETFLARFVAYPSEHARVAHTLWIAHTWFMDCMGIHPAHRVPVPEPGSGKTRALEVTEPLVPRPVHAVNTTPAYLFRKVSDPRRPPTILYDEIDTVFGPKAKDNEDIRGMLNAGHRRGADGGPLCRPRQERRNRGAARLLRGRPGRSRRPARHDHDALDRHADAAPRHRTSRSSRGGCASTDPRQQSSGTAYLGGPTLSRCVLRTLGRTCPQVSRTGTRTSGKPCF